QNVFQLILFRFFQGVGGAMIQTSSRALAAEAVPGELGGRAQGYMTTAHHVGFLLGPTMGGLMIDYLSWRWAFFFLFPIGLLGALLTLGNLKRRTIPSLHHSIDYLGAILLFTTTSTLVLVLDRRTLDIMGIETKIAMAVIFMGSLAGLITHESKSKSPIVNLALFKLRWFTLSTISLLIVTMCYSLTTFLLPFYLQNILHLSPSFIGVLFMAPPIVTIALSLLGGHLSDRFGPRLPASIGVAFLVLSLLVGGFLQPGSHWSLPTFLIALGAITNGIFNPAIAVAMIGMMSKELRGVASAVNHVTFGFGNVLGVALGGLLMTAAFEIHTGLSGVSPTAENPTGFVAALNTTFLIAAGLSLIAVFTSATKGGKTS
ncbi:MAG: MFS transporter, partial [Deltaproteobacteria bacterium]|nr:MFS transporter [Deltaproteobacteria bacterium]